MTTKSKSVDEQSIEQRARELLADQLDFAGARFVRNEHSEILEDVEVTAVEAIRAIAAALRSAEQLHRVANGSVPHIFKGECPAADTSPASRDEGCAACSILAAVDVYLSAPEPVACSTCNGRREVGGHVGQTPEQFGSVTEACPDCAAPLAPRSDDAPREAAQEPSKILAEIRTAADNGGANEGQCYAWWRALSAPERRDVVEDRNALFAVFAKSEEYPWPVRIPGHIGTMAEVRDSVMAKARHEGFKGDFVERMAALGWWLEPLFTHPAPQQRESASEQTGNAGATIYDLAKQCGAFFDAGENPDYSTGFPGSPNTIDFTEQQLEEFVASLGRSAPLRPVTDADADVANAVFDQRTFHLVSGDNAADLRARMRSALESFRSRLAAGAQ